MQPEIEQNPLLRASTQVSEVGTTQAIVTLLAITGVGLALGAWRVATRDWALKE